MSKKPKILLIYTGGTIGMVKDFETGVLKAFNFDKLLENIPELKLLDCEIETFSFETPLDSSNMSILNWIQMAEVIENKYNFNDGFVILHGSDTMSYSASALSFMLENLNKPVIFTGSQLPIGDLRTDAKENLITAIQLASLQKNKLPALNEVCLYFEYKLYRGNRTTKISAEHFNAFASPNLTELAESGVHLKINESLLLSKSKKELKVHKKLNSNVAILKLFPGINETFIKAFFSLQDIKGVIMETYGSGNAPNEDWFIKPLEKAIKNEVKVINVTQCSGGSVQMGHYETSSQLKEIGVISGNDITTEAALAKLMFLLGKHDKDKDFKTLFETPICGEMS